MTELELAKQISKSNYTCIGIDCSECKRVNPVHVCLMDGRKFYCLETFKKYQLNPNAMEMDWLNTQIKTLSDEIEKLK